MVEVPALDRIDFATFGLVLVLLFFGYVIYPTHLTQVAVWFSIVMLFICWTGYFFYKMVYDEVVFWE